MAVVPNTSQPGYVFVSKGTGQNDGFWTPLTDAKDYAWTSALSVTSGATGFLPPFISAINGQLLSVTGQLRSGSATIDIDHNGSAIGGLTSLAISTTATTYEPTNTTLIAIGDTLGPVIDTVTSTPDGLSLSFVIWVYL